MKVISLLQPWASLVVLGAKKIETRSWNTKYRGPLLIHASKSKSMGMSKIEKDAFLGLFYNVHARGALPFAELPFGQIIGKVNLIDTFPTEKVFTGAGGIGFKSNQKVVVDGDFRMMLVSIEEKAFGDYSADRFGWLLSDPVLFKTGIPAKGSLGLWEYTGLLPE